MCTTARSTLIVPKKRLEALCIRRMMHDMYTASLIQSFTEDDYGTTTTSSYHTPGALGAYSTLR